MERFFVDIIGLLIPASVHGFSYVLKLVDEYIKFNAVKLLRVKSEALEKFKELKTEHGCPKSFRSGNGTEFTIEDLKYFCIENQIRPEFTVQNPWAEWYGWKSQYNYSGNGQMFSEAKLPKTY